MNILFSRFNIFLRENFFRIKSPKSAEFEFVENYRNERGKQIIVARVIDSFGKSFKLTATELTLNRKDLLSKFSIHDIVNIVGLAAIEKEPLVTEVKTTAYKYFALFAMLYGATLIASNIASSKLTNFLGVTMTGGTFAYLCSYALGDIVTEVYGYKRARQLIWGAVTCNLFTMLFLYIAIRLPAAEFWKHQSQFELVLGSTQRIILSSLTSFFCSEFLNSYLLSRLKILLEGKYLGIRILLSSVVSIVVDTVLFTLISYYGSVPHYELLNIFVVSYAYSVIWEIVSIPFSVWIITYLKKTEFLDIFDVDTKFTPFSFDVTYSEVNNAIVR